MSPRITDQIKFGTVLYCCLNALRLQLHVGILILSSLFLPNLLLSNYECPASKGIHFTHVLQWFCLHEVHQTGRAPSEASHSLLQLPREMVPENKHSMEYRGGTQLHSGSHCWLSCISIVVITKQSQNQQKLQTRNNSLRNCWGWRKLFFR